MAHKRIYTGIGSRETPPDILQLMANIGAGLAKLDWTLRSGHAPGADMAFEYGCDFHQGKKDIFIPWNGFQGAREGGSYHLPTLVAHIMASEFHPAWERCSQGARALHSRNSHQVMGLELDNPSDMIICWTRDGARKGGTGQALRIAEHFGVPIFDLAICTPEDIINFINHGVLPE